jgi:1-acyl-sn-glycerol-3-phosphate acyltransferase
MMFARLVGAAIIGFTKLLTGAQARWIGCAPLPEQRVYFANHQSHGDFVLLWASLPAAMRARTRPVAARDYWDATPLRRFLIHRVFRGVLVERDPEKRTEDPIDAMVAALDAGDSLILFPEGTRNPGEELLPFKSGIFRLAGRRPRVPLVPAWIENIGRVLPKGEVIPVPLICSIRFGAPLTLAREETKESFLARTRQCVLQLRGKERA